MKRINGVFIIPLFLLFKDKITLLVGKCNRPWLFQEKSLFHYSWKTKAIIPSFHGKKPLFHIKNFPLFLFVFIPRFSTIGCCWCYFHIGLIITLLTLFQHLNFIGHLEGKSWNPKADFAVQMGETLRCTRSLFSLLAASSFVTLMTFLSQTSFSNEAQIRWGGG